MTCRIHSDDGYSLMEMMIVVFILAILVFIAVASFYLSTYRATEASCDANTRQLTTACNTYASGHDNEYPTDLDELRPFVNSDSGFGLCPTDGTTTYDLDPVTGTVTCPIHP